MRLAKYIADCGVASRRHAERLVKGGRVLVDGERVIDPARDVAEHNEVVVDGRAISLARHEYHLLNKPAGVVSTAHDPEGRRKVTDLVAAAERIYPVGRLDAETTGLILLTNDGEITNRLTHPRFEVEKAYHARVQGSVSERAVYALRSGVELDDGRTAPAKVRVLKRSSRTTLLEVIIHEGRKRQVRRMCEAVGHPVIALERVRYGPLALGDLQPGASRRLEPDEVDRLRKAANRS